MQNNYSFKLTSAAVLLSVVLPGVVFAAPGMATTTHALEKTTVSTDKITVAKDKANQEIDRRITSLTELSTRIQTMQKVSDELKKALATNVQNEITALTALKSTIAGDTDSVVLKSDIKSIRDSYRTYMLVMPQVRITAAADRAATTISMMATVGTKLQARIADAQAKGTDVTKLTEALTDLGVQLTDANKSVQDAVNASSSLVPDQGDATKMKANTTALKTARADMQAAQKSLQDARKDIDTIMTGLKIAGAVTASTTPVR